MTSRHPARENALAITTPRPAGGAIANGAGRGAGTAGRRHGRGLTAAQARAHSRDRADGQHVFLDSYDVIYIDDKS
jgi:hypothetical protein